MKWKSFLWEEDCTESEKLPKKNHRQIFTTTLHILSEQKCPKESERDRQKEKERVVSAFLLRRISHIFHSTPCYSSICKPLNESANFSTDFDLFPQWDTNAATDWWLLHNELWLQLLLRKGFDFAQEVAPLLPEAIHWDNYYFSVWSFGEFVLSRG